MISFSLIIIDFKVLSLLEIYLLILNVCILYIYSYPSIDDVIGTLLSLYMHDSSQSLPTTEEVLICTSDTTAEEVGCRQKLG